MSGMSWATGAAVSEGLDDCIAEVAVPFGVVFEVLIWVVSYQRVT